MKYISASFYLSLFILTCLFLLPPSINAQSLTNRPTTYYISSSQGNDNNTGTSPEAPWKSLGKVYVKGLPSSKSKFLPGDSVLLKAGDTFYDTLSIYATGSKDNPITIGRYDSGSDPIIIGDNSNVVWSSVSGHPGVYSATLEGAATVTFVYDVNGNPYRKRARGTEDLNTWLSNFVINDWGFTFDTRNLIYIRTPDGNPPPQMRLFQYSSVFFQGDYITIENLDIRRVHSGIVGNVSKGAIIRNNSIQDTHGTAFYCSGCTYGEMANNTLTRGGWTLFYLTNGQNNWVHHNTLSYAIPTILGININGKELCGFGLERGINNLIEHNSISNVKDSFFDYWLEVDSIVRYNYGFHSGGAAYPTGTGLKVHNNIFNVDGGKGIGGAHSYDSVKSPAPDSGNNLVYNNIVYNFVNYGLYGGANASEGTVFRNNIVVAKKSTSALALLNTGINSDYNFYWNTAGAPKGWFWDGKNNVTFEAFKTVSNQESHGLYADPQFVSDNPVTADDFKLKPTSPYLNVGQNLKSAGFISSSDEYKDYVGIFIPQGSAPDAGPYELIDGNNQSSTPYTPSASSTPSTPSTPPPPSVTPLDSDSDGIANISDKCPNTPRGVRVNNYGCAIPLTTKFTITNNIDNADLNSISLLNIGNTLGRIIYNTPVSLVKTTGDRLDIDSNLSISKGYISLDSTKVPELNKGATVTLYNITATNPKIMKDGVLCTTCTIVSYSNGTLVFIVPGF